LETPNLDYLKQISGGDIEFEKSMLAVLKLDFAIEYAAIQANYEKNNFEQLILDIHKIKNKIGILGMKKSLALASECEKSIKKVKKEKFDDLLLILTKINIYLNNI
jgi:HPt (histidine-containing phosphotransfer) domain-containing protein